MVAVAFNLPTAIMTTLLTIPLLNLPAAIPGIQPVLLASLVVVN